MNFKNIDFLLELEKMKNIKRRSKHLYDDERESDAEHSFYVAIMALFMDDYLDNAVDINRVIKMLLVHDLVEIYAGDTFAYDEEANLDKKERENKAFEKIIGQLDVQKSKLYMSLWKEFEEQETLESKYANSLDRLAPIMLNYFKDGGTWVEYCTKKSQVDERAEIIRQTSPKLSELVDYIINDSFKKGYFSE